MGREAFSKFRFGLRPKSLGTAALRAHVGLTQVGKPCPKWKLPGWLLS